MKKTKEELRYLQKLIFRATQDSIEKERFRSQKSSGIQRDKAYVDLGTNDRVAGIFFEGIKIGSELEIDSYSYGYYVVGAKQVGAKVYDSEKEKNEEIGISIGFDEYLLGISEERLINSEYGLNLKKYDSYMAGYNLGKLGILSKSSSEDEKNIAVSACKEALRVCKEKYSTYEKKVQELEEKLKATKKENLKLEDKIKALGKSIPVECVMDIDSLFGLDVSNSELATISDVHNGEDMISVGDSNFLSENAMQEEVSIAVRAGESVFREGRERYCSYEKEIAKLQHDLELSQGYYLRLSKYLNTLETEDGCLKVGKPRR